MRQCVLPASRGCARASESFHERCLAGRVRGTGASSPRHPRSGDTDSPSSLHIRPIWAHARRRNGFFVWASAGAATALILISGFVVLVAVRERSREAVWPKPILIPASSICAIPGAGFAAVTPETHLRGGSADREPAQLLTARAEIERKLEAAPADPHWLQLEARADLIEEKYDPAIDILDRLLAAGPVTPESARQTMLQPTSSGERQPAAKTIAPRLSTTCAAPTNWLPATLWSCSMKPS